MKFGLKNQDINFIKEKLSEFSEISKVLIFGSRSIGNFKQSSDIDLCLFGDKISLETISKINDLLQNQSPMPYLFDIISYEQIKSENLKQHINKFGKEFYSKKSLT